MISNKINSINLFYKISHHQRENLHIDQTEPVTTSMIELLLLLRHFFKVWFRIHQQKMKRKLNDAIASSSSLGSISEGYKSDDEKSDDVGGESEVVNVEEDHMDEKENNNNDINYASSHNIAPSDGNEEFDIEQITGFSACSSVENYEFLNNIGSGTFGVVSRGKCKTTGEIVALKRIKLMKDFTSKEGFPLTALREMNTLLQMRHENLVCAREVVCGSDLNKIFIVMDYMDHTLKDVMERYRFSVSEGKRLMIQLLSGLQYIHEDCWLIHRDLKSSNILLGTYY